MISNSQVDKKQIGSRIGKVTLYSDKEGTYSGNFSNSYPRGTAFYKIIDVDIHDAIAIKESNGMFVKATYHGEYAGSTLNWQDVAAYSLGVLLLIIMISSFVNRRLKP
ncbi:hypothetical protein GK047_26340 [Paenibacillus sp. SYP-B3998]|uniref:Uncharacterized protein n=1 Tax=Paenibacillus sp. SYP-B3998 TaxID=2678564 RepID=A0A6G4A4M8_9BACL|nr:hypothetical protein [Paenibacillus sp. SYP-B3998]